MTDSRIESALDSTFETEQAVLGAMLADPDFAMPIVSNHLTAADFLRPRHKALFHFCEKLWNEGVVIDPVTLRDRMAKSPGTMRVFETNGDLLSFLSEYIDMVPTAANVEDHCRILTSALTRRKVAGAADRLLQCVRDGEIDVKLAVQEAFTALLPVVTDDESHGFRPIDAVSVILDMEDRGNNPQSVVRCGFSAIDEEFYGFRPGELYIIGGGPKSGKTSFTLSLALNIAEAGHGVGFVECEMTRAAITERLLNNTASVTVGQTARGRFEPDEIERLGKAATFLRRLPMEIDDSALPSIEDVSHRVMELKARKPDTKVVVVDFLQLLSTTLHRGMNKNERLEYVSYQLEGLSKRAEVAVIAPCQTNYKDHDKRLGEDEKREPELRDLQGSSGMAQAATGVFLVWHDDAPPGPWQTTDKFHVKCDASRRTRLFHAVLDWHGRYMRVSEPPRTVPDSVYGGHT